MKKILLFLMVLLGVVNTSYATPITEAAAVKNLMALGMSAALATQVADIAAGGVYPTDSLIPAADNTYDVGSSSFGWRTGYFDTSVITPLVSHATALALGIAGTAEVTVKDDELEFSAAGKIDSASPLSFALVNTNELQLYNDQLFFTGSSAVIGSAGAFVIRADDDVQRVFTYDASSDTALSLAFGDGTASQNLDIKGTTSDAADSQSVCISGGGACGNSARGSYVSSGGNESGGPGVLDLAGGNVSGGAVNIRTGNAVTRQQWDLNGSLYFPVSNPDGSSAATSISTGNTIDTTVQWQRVTNAGAVTGIILENGTAHGQIVYVTVDKDAVGSVTMAAEATSNVCSGTGAVIAAGETALFIFDNEDTCWSENSGG